MALGAEAGRRARRPDPHRRRRDDAAQRLPEPFILPARSLYAADSFKLDVAGGGHGHARQHLHARARRGGRHLRAGVRDRRARRAARDGSRSSCAIRNEPEKDPTSGNAVLLARTSCEAYRAGAERFGWDNAHPRPGARREGEWLIGMGCATATYPYYRMPGGAARITLTADGHATVEIAAHEMGMGTATVQAQVAAERLGLPLEQVTFDYGDTAFPGVVLAGGSQQTASIGAAVIAAHRAAGGRAAQARRQRLAARRARAGRGRRRRRRPLQARRARAARELRLDPRPRASARR